MWPVLFFIGVLLLSSLFSWLLRKEERKVISACGGTLLASLAGLIYTLFTFKTPKAGVIFKTSIPNISISMEIDALSSFFLIIIFGISVFAAIYGLSYVKGQKRLAAHIPFFPLLVASMIAIVCSRDVFSFLIFWELMSLSSFFLVTAEHESREVQNAGWIYLIATQLATAFLMVFFLVLARENGSLLFKDFIANYHLTPFLSGLLFIFALIGFGTKAGIFPLHVWLPHSYSAASGYIFVLMSSVMIKIGIYGILRAVTFLGPPPVWWGVLILIVGALSALVGIIFALMQNNLRRMLAYSSIENIGIIMIGVGVGLIGVAKEDHLVALLGLAGALFHIFNHAIFKGLLFLAAGSIARSVRVLVIDDLGGLFKKMPITGAAFLVGALSICGLPPFNGFISEWLIYLGLFQGGLDFSGYLILALVAALVAIAFAGGLAVTCFTKAFGVSFLGCPRKLSLDDCREGSRFITIPMIGLALLCLSIGLFPSHILSLIIPSVEMFLRSSVSEAQIDKILSPLNYVSAVFAFSIALTGLFLFIYQLIFRKKSVTEVVTWDCGYDKPTAKMQYTSSSFTEPVGTFFRQILNPVTNHNQISGIFPKASAFEEHVNDIAEEKIFNPPFAWMESILLFIRHKKKNTIQSYLALMFLTLLLLFIWEVWIGF